jgi:hypothetical protein
MTKIEYLISWDALNTRLWTVREMCGPDCRDIKTGLTRPQARAELDRLNAVPMKQRVRA